MIRQAFIVKKLFVGKPPNISVEKSFLNASPYCQRSSYTYFKVLKYQILLGTTENVPWYVKDEELKCWN